VSAVVIGNPKLSSRTLDASLRLHVAIIGSAPDVIVEVAELGPGLLGFGDPGVTAAVESVHTSGFAVVASPTYKASYTGLLKLFLDQFAGGEGLRDVVVVALMLGAGPAHAMAADVFLKPVLVELGATVPAPGLFLSDSTYLTDGVLEKYVDRWGAILNSARR
jgi:FMN reductase